MRLSLIYSPLQCDLGILLRIDGFLNNFKKNYFQGNLQIFLILLIFLILIAAIIYHQKTNKSKKMRERSLQ
ncbi:hypothetical protein pb186bvf_019751 [Paramecium bursaria]